MLKAKIVEVSESSGVRARELAWESLVQADPRDRWSDVAVRAAEKWYAETDQCSEAHVTVRIIAADGTFSDFAVACQPRVRFESREIVSSDGTVGRRQQARPGPFVDTRPRDLKCAIEMESLQAALGVIAARCAKAAMGQMEYPMDRIVRDLRAVCV